MYKKLYKIRKENKLSIYDMSEKTKINPVHYYLIEQGKRILYYDAAIKISAVFNMKPDDIFYTKTSY
jgi:transcriptional regulator with XRE-family HTH domain